MCQTDDTGADPPPPSPGNTHALHQGTDKLFKLFQYLPFEKPPALKISSVFLFYIKSALSTGSTTKSTYPLTRPGTGFWHTGCTSCTFFTIEII